MASVSKEKNLFIITVGDNKHYTIDINDGTMLGVSGKPVKQMGSKYKSEFTNYYPNSKIPNSFGMTVLHRYIHYQISWGNPVCKEGLVFADKVDALNDKVVSDYAHKYIGWIHYFGKYDFKKIVRAIRENPDVNSTDVVNMLEQERMRQQYGEQINIAPREMNCLKNTLGGQPTLHEVAICSYYLNTQHLREMNLFNMLLQYIERCRDLQVEPRKNNNVLREFYETNQRWAQMKEVINNRKFAENYAKHPKAWQFEYGNFIVRIPTNGADLIREGAEMHHCVGGYVDRVADGNCFICFIRNKANPDKPYITCQVHNNGTIGQYYLAYDKYIDSDEDKAFKKAYQEYLKKIWEN